MSSGIFLAKQRIWLFFENFLKKLKLFSKTPLKNVKKYNIMVAIIGFVLKTTVLAKERTSNAR